MFTRQMVEEFKANYTKGIEALIAEIEAEATAEAEYTGGQLPSFMIDKLEAKGFRRWTKGKYDRLYIKPTFLGLNVGYYNTGNISYSDYKGERISHSAAGRLLAGKYYIDVATGDIHTDGPASWNDEMKTEIKKLMRA